MLPGSYEGFLGPLGNVLKSIGWTFNGTPFWAGTEVMGWLVVAYVCLWLLPNTQQIFRKYRPSVSKNLRLFRSVHFMSEVESKISKLDSMIIWRINTLNGSWIVGIAVISMIFLLVGHDHEFIYFQF